MKAVRFDTYGDPSVLHQVEVAPPRPAAGEVAVQIQMAAVNHFDLDLRSGASRLPLKLPHQLGLEGVGTVVERGEGANDFGVGDQVIIGDYVPCGRCPPCRSGLPNLCEELVRPGVERAGTYAEVVAVPEAGLHALPAGVEPKDATGLVASFGTAYHALIVRGRLETGESVVVTGASGGVGSALVQLAHQAGARVIGVVGTPGKAEAVRGLGADVVLVAQDGDLASRLRTAVGGDGADLVVDGVGGPYLAAGLRALRPGGRQVVYGAHGGETADLDLVAFFRTYVALIASTGCTRQDTECVLDLLAKGKIRMKIHAVMPLADAHRAHEMLERREAIGKVLLRPSA